MINFYHECQECCYDVDSCECDEAPELNDCLTRCMNCNEQADIENIGKNKRKYTCESCKISEIETISE